jgi:hypothetical protein
MTDQDLLEDGRCQGCGALPEYGQDSAVDAAQGDRRRCYVVISKNEIEIDADGIPVRDHTVLFQLGRCCWDSKLVPALAALGIHPIDAGDAAQ